ncbi:hypothetical protein DFH08DRAFT_936539 [Mycena albidolilacea]|uniref:Transposase n=1 Tax=Mycena albidolilacea TaxID=1033008 RepID=A0AAD7A1H7_9AGAR|nr:hypothetical protein DFH08DRAFT_936539 [Mycena albidolilacea]
MPSYTRCNCSACGPAGQLQLDKTMRLHARIDARKHLHSILVAPSGTSSGPSHNDQSASPDQQLEPVSDAESQSDNGDDYLIFERLVKPSDSDENSDSPEVADESSEDEEIVVDEPRDEDVDDIASDPLFRTRASLFDAFQQGQENPADESIVPSAFNDHPAIRNAYIRAFVGAAFEGMTRNAAANMLEGSRVIFLSAEASGSEFQGLSHFARTLPTVEKRLGVSTDELIIYLFLCPTFWKPHFPAELARLDSPDCQELDCDGKLYTVKRLSSGAEKRTPILTLPFVPPERVIQRMCLQPGKVAQWQEWRGPDDGAGKKEPSKLKGYAAFPDPDKPMTDITDGWGWRAIQAGLERHRNGVWEVRDVDVLELKQQFVALPNGIVIQINIDWFQAIKNGCHSTGAMYATICNTPRRFRYLREETILLMIFPGPHEPTSEQFNNVMHICVKHFKKLYSGVFFDVHGKDEPEPFHVQIGSDVSDLPASRKTSGLLSFTSKFFMCDHCETRFYDLVVPDAFDSTKIKERDPWRYLKYAFRARDASEEVAEEIRPTPWSVTGLFDLMHAIFGTTIKHLCKNILWKNGMVNTKQTEKITKFFTGLIWPPSISHLPPSVARGAGSIKADQWRSQIAVFFVALFDAWQVNGEIPDIDAKPSPPNTKNASAQAAQEKLIHARMCEHLLTTKPDASEDELESIDTIKMDRSLRRHYETVVQFTAAVRIITSNSISPNEVRRGCGALELAVQSWARMHCHLVPYFHFAALHLEEQFLKHGPAPGWWTYPYERKNGFLGRFNHNGHSGGELEGPEDRNSLNVLKSYLKGGTSERKDAIDFPKFSQQQSLRQLGSGYYKRVFDYLKVFWSSDVQLVPDVSLVANSNQHSFSGNVQAFSHCWVGTGLKHKHGENLLSTPTSTSGFW